MEMRNIQGPVKTRFAPSPTGSMHVGNFRVALFNYLFALRHQGSFLLRIEDTDIERSDIQFRDAILADLEWAGIHWQEGPFYQSERQALYQTLYTKLEAKNLVYPCFCSETQLALARKVQLASNQAPRYPGTCRNLTTAEIKAKLAEGLLPSLRFRVPQNQILEFQDLIKGPQRFESNHIGDFIIRRMDKTAPFMFCNAVDDAMMGVTHALRGDDHLTNTPRQRLILEALALTPPSYGHFPTILGPDGKPLSKRNGSRSIQELKEDGFFPISIINYLARLGHFDPDMTLLDLEGLSQHFDLANISHSPAHYDVQQLMHWQKESMHTIDKQLCWNSIAPYVSKWVAGEHETAFVETVQPNLVLPKDAALWAEAMFAHDVPYLPEVQPVLKNPGPEFFIYAAELLKKTPTMNFSTLANELGQRTGLKGKAVFQPLRAALTGQLYGPELARILSLMGPEKAQHRFLEAAHYVTNL